MKCAVAFAVLLAGCRVLLGESPSPSSTLLEDLVRMTRAGSPDSSVLAYARAHRGELPAEVSDASLRWLRASGVSERVVRSMSAIDVRISASDRPEGVAYADETEGVGRRRAYSSETEEDRDAGSSYGGLNANAGDASGYDADFWYGSDPYFGYPYLSAPYVSFAFADRGGFFRRFPRRDRDHRDHRFDGGHRDAWRDRGGSRDAWRERGSGGRRGGSMAAGPRNTGRPAFAAGRAPGGRGRAIGAPGGFGPSWSAHGNSSGFRAPRGGNGSPRGSPSAPSGARARTGGGFARGSIGTSQGGRGRR